MLILVAVISTRFYTLENTVLLLEIDYAGIAPDNAKYRLQPLRVRRSSLAEEYMEYLWLRLFTLFNFNQTILQSL